MAATPQASAQAPQASDVRNVGILGHTFPRANGLIDSITSYTGRTNKVSILLVVRCLASGAGISPTFLQLEFGSVTRMERARRWGLLADQQQPLACGRTRRSTPLTFSWTASLPYRSRGHCKRLTARSWPLTAATGRVLLPAVPYTRSRSAKQEDDRYPLLQIEDSDVGKLVPLYDVPQLAFLSRCDVGGNPLWVRLLEHRDFCCISSIHPLPAQLS